MTGVGRRSGRYSQAARVQRLVSYLAARRHGAALADLADELGVSERQARRDLSVLAELGYACETERRRGRAWVRLLDRRPEALRLTARELFALLAMRESVAAWEEGPFAEDARRVFDKVVAALPADEQDRLAALEPALACVAEPGAKSYAADDDLLDALLTGLMRRWRVRSAYRSRRGHVRHGELEPWGLVIHRQALYVVGRLDDGTAESAEVRTYAVERFERAEFLRRRTFTVPEGFDLRERFDDAFGITLGGEPRRVVVDFAPDVADLVRARRWHPSQQLTELEDGGVRLSLRITSAAELVPWVLRWGALAKVREPADVAARVRAEHRDAAG